MDENLILRAMPVMERAATHAGSVLAEKQPLAKQIKQERKDFLTDTDSISERIIIRELNKAFPTIPCYSEEAGGAESGKGYLWVIDPLDGTVNYFHQDQYYWGVSIALVFDGRTEAGTVYLPGQKKIFTARREGENFRTGVSGKKNLSESQIWTSWTKRDKTSALKILEKLNRHTLYPQIRLCATAEMMEVSTGRIDGYVHPGPEPFDIAAAGLIVEKAGGRVTDIKGNPWTPFSKSIIATNGLIHDDLVAALNS